ncbi:diguanylate cyclase with PAS/PAC sensor [Hydrogenobaculum sp. Y04AAS1]|nr:diguanylate cyclase with PAS/PAC sensor [Hydrogenobaculum sp. Y04AAS1]HCT67161.1 sensor domain-containing diguanylate cyclase [Hydrogenobaculum sp.]
MSMLNCTYENTIKALWEDYLKTDTVDQELLKNIGKEAYDKTHITYMKHNLEYIKNDITKSLIKKGLLTEETYDKLISFFEKLKNTISRYYSFRCVEESDKLESMLYTEDILPELLKPSAYFKDAITKDYIELSKNPSITFDSHACPVYKEIENSAMPEDVKKDVHKAHERLHYVAKYFYKLIEQGDIDNLYGIYWRMRYLNILIVTAISIYTLKSEMEFYKTFLEGHSIPILLVDPDTYSIANANQAALDFYGYTKEEITTLKNWDINTLGEEKMKELARKAKYKELNFFKLKHRLKSGEIRDVEVYSSPVHLNGKTYLLSIINDITKEERIRKAFEIFKEIEHLSLTSDSEDGFFEKLLDMFEKEDMFKDVCILRKQKNGFYINSTSETCIEDVNKEINFPIIKAFNTKSTVYYENSNEIEDDAIRQKLIEKETLSSIAMPISENGNIYGSICICSKVKNYFEDYKEILSNLKDRIENALKTIELRKKLNYQNDLVNSIVKNTQVGVLVFDEDNIYYENDYLLELLGYTHEDIKTLSIFDILSPIHVKDIIKALTNKTPIILQEFHILNKKNQTLYVKGSLNFIKDVENKPVAVFTFVDITKEKELSDMLLKQSTEDPLTGIYNRRYLENKLEEYVKLAKRHDRPLSLIMFDIDFFKHINDSFGHDVGDKVLKAIAKVVSENIRNTDIFARYGGEEFVIIAPETTKEDAKILAEKLRSLIRNLHFEEGINVTCSFGVASLEKHDTKETLLKRADEALYEAKKTGRNKVVVT